MQRDGKGTSVAGLNKSKPAVVVKKQARHLRDHNSLGIVRWYNVLKLPAVCYGGCVGRIFLDHAQYQLKLPFFTMVLIVRFILAPPNNRHTVVASFASAQHSSIASTKVAALLCQEEEREWGWGKRRLFLSLPSATCAACSCAKVKFSPSLFVPSRVLFSMKIMLPTCEPVANIEHSSSTSIIG